mgnify:FL=1
MRRSISAFIMWTAAALTLASGCQDLSIQYSPEALQDISDRQPAISLHAEQSADNVVKIVMSKGNGFTTSEIYAESTQPAGENQSVQIQVGGEEDVAAYSLRTGIAYKLLPAPFYTFTGGQTLTMHEGSEITAPACLRIFAANPLDNVLEAGRYLLPLSAASLWHDSVSGTVYVDVTVNEPYSDPDGCELYTGDDMFTVFYLNTAVFDPRLANDFILETIKDKDYRRGLGNIVNLRQASLNYDVATGRVSVKPTGDLRYVLEHFTERVLPVQESGRKVCVCIDGGAQGIGFCNLTDEQIGDFTHSVKRMVDYYGLDGVNLWDRNANYAAAVERGFPPANTTSYPKLIKALREALGQNRLLTITDYEEPTEYFWDTEATGGIRVGEYIDYAWSGYCSGDEPVQIVDPWHQELSFVSRLHPRKPFAGLNPKRYGITNVTCYRLAEESIFLLESYDKTLLADGNVFVFYDIRSNVQDAYEGANIMDRFMKSWYGDPFLQTNIKRLTNFNFTPSHPTNYNKWGKDW